MLRGPLARPMLLFSLPLIASGILQQSFNSVDVAVVGRFAGSQALAAVGSNGPVISLLVNMFIGLAVGVNVVIANYIGRNNSRGVGAAVTASAQLALIGGIALFALAMMASRPILEVLNTPADVLDQAVLYLRIYSAGMPFMVIYNFGAAILRSIGDTQRPFYSLVAAGIVNVGLNFLFVAGMGMDVDGVAWATVISNIVNAAIITGILIREQGDIHLDLRAVFGSRPDGSQLRKIAGIGVPAGLQGTVFAFSNVFILSAINTFGSAGAAGSATAINFEVYCYFVLNAFGQTAVAFTSQNYGAGRLDRCRHIPHIPADGYSVDRGSQRPARMGALRRHSHFHRRCRGGTFRRRANALRASLPRHCLLLRDCRSLHARTRLLYDSGAYHHIRHLRATPRMGMVLPLERRFVHTPDDDIPALVGAYRCCHGRGIHPHNPETQP